MANIDFGSLAEWVGIVATVLTIILTIRHYGKDNQKDIRFMVYQKNKQDKTEDGVVRVLNGTEIFIHVYNNSKMPIMVRIEGLRNKKGLLKRIYGDIIGKQNLIPLDPFEAMLTEKIEYLKVEPYDLSDPIKIDTEYLKLHLENNSIDPNQEIEILFREIAGTYNCVSLQTIEKPKHILEVVVEFVMILYKRSIDFITGLFK